MDWIKIAIPLIAVAVWILSNLARNREEPRRPARPTPPASGSDDPPGGPRPRRSAAEIEQFLQEVRRRRDMSDPQRARKLPEPPRPEPKRELKTLGGRTITAQPAPTTGVSPPVSAPAPSRHLEPIPMVRVVDSPQDDVVVAHVVEEASPARFAAPVVSSRTRLPPPASGPQLLRTLRNPQSLASAMVLREILDPPICRRRRRIT